MLAYSCGLRVSEIVRLRVHDIDRTRKTLHIRNSKGKKDRYVILADCVLKSLIEYWHETKFNDYVFPGQRANMPISTSTASAVYKNAKTICGITKSGGIHSLRHAFATHMLEDGVDILVIQRLLGHASISSTARYLRVTPKLCADITLPIDTLKL